MFVSAEISCLSLLGVRLRTQEATDSIRKSHDAAELSVTRRFDACNCSVISDDVIFTVVLADIDARAGKIPTIAHSIIKTRYEFVTIKAVPMFDAFVSTDSFFFPSSDSSFLAL